MQRPVAITEPRGLRFHGWICRDLSGVGRFAPRALRVERLDAAGKVTDFVERSVSLPVRTGCAIYDVPTSWTLGPEEGVRLCAANGYRSCPLVRTDRRDPS